MSWVAALGSLAAPHGGSGAPDSAHAAYLHEFPHPRTVVQFHPRRPDPFTLQDLRRALALGASAVELDLRWRASDGAVVCGHERRGLESRPTLEEALRVIDAFRGERPTVRGDGLQFFVVLDLKDENEAFHRALVKALDAQGERLASSRTPRSHPAPITVLVTGFRAALERSIPRERLDARCLIEGRDYGGRIEALGGPARFQWIALDYPIDRERVRAIHEGRDPRARGRFNVRIVAAGRNLAAAIRAGADAVNADLDEISAAVRLAAPPRPSSARSRREGSPAP